VSVASAPQKPVGTFTGLTTVETVRWPGRPGMTRVWTVISEPILATYGVWFVWASSPGMRDRPFHCTAFGNLSQP
jgi:hypothetical protein